VAAPPGAAGDSSEPVPDQQSGMVPTLGATLAVRASWRRTRIVHGARPQAFIHSPPKDSALLTLGLPTRGKRTGRRILKGLPHSAHTSSDRGGCPLERFESVQLDHDW
jgi:hypothetical protein